jgi:hypothetical protein
MVAAAGGEGSGESWGFRWGKFCRYSNKSSFLFSMVLQNCNDPDFIFLPFHDPAVTFTVSSQLSDCEKYLWRTNNRSYGAQTTISWRTDIGDVQHDIMQQILHIFVTLDSRTIQCEYCTIYYGESTVLKVWRICCIISCCTSPISVFYEILISVVCALGVLLSSFYSHLTRS